MLSPYTITDPIEITWNDVIQRITTEYLSEDQSYPWIIGFSGGKDSTLVAHAVLEAVLGVPPSQRKREVHVVSNDTLVESLEEFVAWRVGILSPNTLH